MSRKRLTTLFIVFDLIVLILLGAWLVLDARNPCRTQRPLLPESWFADAKKPAPMCGYRVVTVFPHARDSFIEGLQWIDGVFIESSGLVGQSTLRRVDPETGTVLQRIDLDPEPRSDEVELLFRCVSAPDLEDRIALRAGQRPATLLIRAASKLGIDAECAFSSPALPASSALT